MSPERPRRPTALAGQKLDASGRLKKMPTGDTTTERCEMHPIKLGRKALRCAELPSGPVIAGTVSIDDKDSVSLECVQAAVRARQRCDGSAVRDRQLEDVAPPDALAINERRARPKRIPIVTNANDAVLMVDEGDGGPEGMHAVAMCRTDPAAVKLLVIRQCRIGDRIAIRDGRPDANAILYRSASVVRRPIVGSAVDNDVDGRAVVVKRGLTVREA